MMNSFKDFSKQRGFSAICFFVNIIFVLLLVYLGVKLIPSYLEYRVLSNAVDDVLKRDDIATLSARRIRGSMGASIKRNSGVNPSTLDLNKVAYIATRDGQKLVGINYEVAIELYDNFSALMHYKYEKAATRE